MSSLKELTQSQHRNAERQKFVKVLMSGKINPKLYATYLWNQHKKYELLETLAESHGILDDLPGVSRHLKIEQDFNELWSQDELPTIVPSTTEYILHMKEIMQDPISLTAHIYTLHMGDLSGGQMIARKVPGSKQMYNFAGDTTALKEAIRNKITDDMASEAIYVFESATKLFQELMELDIEHYME